MDKQLILNKYSKPEDKLLISKMLDKIELSKSKNRIEYTDFLDMNQKHLLEKILIQENVENYIIDGGSDNTERTTIIFYPDKLKQVVDIKYKAILPIICIRINLPKEMYGKYSHRDYLGGLIKLGIKREKIGDIFVFEDGADILVLDEISKFLLNNISTLTRFSKSKIEKIDIEDIRKKQENKEEYQIELIITKAEHTTADIGAEAFPDVLADFATKYEASNKNRTTNLALAVNKINGVVLMPGEEFSYNKVVGERTIEAGYKEAKIYSNGQVIDGLGGGICQVSSTLYNSVLLSNLEITERHNHQFTTSYVAAGRDATVAWGAKDFKFVNNRKYPIKIEASVKNGICKISIYGVKEEIEYNVDIEVEQISVKPYSTKYEENPDLDVGVEKIKQNGTNGRVTATYKVLSRNGMIVSRTLLSKDNYNAIQKIVIKGTKVAESSDNTNN